MSEILKGQLYRNSSDGETIFYEVTRIGGDALIEINDSPRNRLRYVKLSLRRDLANKDELRNHLSDYGEVETHVFEEFKASIKDKVWILSDKK